jgi:3,4-dihydroxy 2-butanone 4-phosphate synthase/GTP cyclohydrolase II
VATQVQSRGDQANDRHFGSVQEAIAELRAGRMIVLCDDEDRENEGDLVLAAELATPETINYMMTHGRGLVCVALSVDRCRDLGLELMVPDQKEATQPAFTVSIDARDADGGASAADRARTIRVAAAEGATPDDLVKGGHLFALRARPGGVLERPGHTEASVELATLAGLAPAAVLCEVLNEDGSMARVPDLLPFCSERQLKMFSIADLVQFRSITEGATG